LLTYGPALLVASIVLVTLSVAVRRPLAAVPALLWGALLYWGMYSQPSYPVMYLTLALGYAGWIGTYLWARHPADPPRPVRRRVRPAGCWVSRPCWPATTGCWTWCSPPRPACAWPDATPRPWATTRPPRAPPCRVRPGDLLRIRLVNGLDQPTNLHTHGPHVSPQPGADDPFGTVAPGDAFDYAYRIPPEHPAGTF